MSIYVEIRICTSLDELWRVTQTPDLHARWDLRFTDIEYLPRPDESVPQQFLYATRIGFGLAIRGGGESVGQRNGDCGEHTSALKFWSDDSKSLIREGAGYWRYVPLEKDVRFLTSYDYRVRFGALGKLFDKLLFRPLLGWATAWSFDRLRLWLEKGIDPAVSMQRSLIHAIARIAVALVWLYQGLVPKLLEQHADELAMIQQVGFSSAAAPQVVRAIGWCEVIFGVVMLCLFRQRWQFLLTMALMILATVSTAIYSPQFLTAAFNPISLNLLMIALAGIGWVVSRDFAFGTPLLAQAAAGAAKMSSIYQEVLGADFQRLHPQIQKRFGFNSADGLAAIGTGVMKEIWHGRFYTLPFLYLGTWRRIMFPERGTNVPFTIQNYAYKDSFGRETVTWLRTFQTKRPRRFDAYMIHSAQRGKIVDYLGTHQHLAVDIEMTVDERGGLRLRSGEQRFYEGPVAFRFPMLFSGVAEVCEWYDDAIQKFRIEVRVVNRVWGPLFGYHGSFDVQWNAINPQDIPSYIKPCREERRE